MKININQVYRHWPILILLAIAATSGFGQTSEFDIAGKPVQVHGFASQGFAISGSNNYLTMDTSSGSFAFTDGGVNISTLLTDRLRVGAQLYSRNIGQLGRGHVSLDWALVDYKVKDWLGIRAGKVKTALGLMNDTQDNEFLHTWAILPQSVYPLDLRASTISHTGGDVYGDVALPRGGSFSYTVYAGTRPDDHFGGYRYNLQDIGARMHTLTGVMFGYDVRWATPIAGLQLGTSLMNETEHSVGEATVPFLGQVPFTVDTGLEHIFSGYADYQRGKWHLSGEFRRDLRTARYTYAGVPSVFDANDISGFVAAAYRIARKVEIGTYHSRYVLDQSFTPQDPNSNHIIDQAVTARFDLKSWWNVKVEGHFINGYGDRLQARGFYPGSNPAGLKPETNLFVVRTGFMF